MIGIGWQGKILSRLGTWQRTWLWRSLISTSGRTLTAFQWSLGMLSPNELCSISPLQRDLAIRGCMVVGACYSNHQTKLSNFTVKMNMLKPWYKNKQANKKYCSTFFSLGILIRVHVRGSCVAKLPATCQNK